MKTNTNITESEQNVSDEASRKMIAQLNDNLRKSFSGGRVFFTSGIQAIDKITKGKLFFELTNYDNFNADNDIFEEHDFGEINIGKTKIFWKIDYYDLAMKFHSPDPSNPALTNRVITIMLASEY